MKAGDICRVGFPQPDGNIKGRPVVLIKEVPPFKDWMVALVTGKTRNMDSTLDYLLRDSDSGFSGTGLTKTSLIRMGVISTINTGLIQGKLGELPYGVLPKLKSNLSQFILK